MTPISFSKCIRIQIILILSIIFITPQASEITCNALAKGHYNTDNSFNFTVISATNQSWIILQECQMESNWCQPMNLYKLSQNNNNSWIIFDGINNINNDCGTLTVNNIISGQYRFNSASCSLSNYSLFMGCSDDISIADTNDYIPYHYIPSYVSEISCDIIISGHISSSQSKQYYKFNVLDTMEWISFDTCTDTNFYIDRLVIYMFDGRMKWMQSHGNYTNCLKVNATNIGAGIYYISIESESEGQYTLNMECSNNDRVEIADDYNAYYQESKHDHISYLHIIAILLIIIIAPLIGFCAFKKLWKWSRD